MNSWEQAAVLFTILVLGVFHADRYEMSPPLALTMLMSYLWLTWLFFRGVLNFLNLG